MRKTRFSIGNVRQQAAAAIPEAKKIVWHDDNSVSAVINNQKQKIGLVVFDIYGAAEFQKA